MSKNKVVNFLLGKQGETHQTDTHNAAVEEKPWSEFESRLYLTHRTYLLKVPKSIAQQNSLQGGEVLKVAIIKKVSDY